MDFKRKVIAILLTVVLVAPFFVGIGWVIYDNIKSNEPEKLIYMPINNGTAYSVKSARIDGRLLGKVKILSKYKGLPVIKIADSAFSREEKMTKITIPASVTEIGASAFSGCIQLSSITIPPNVTKIGSSAFAFCEKISDIQIPASMTEIGGGAFSHMGIQSITIPKNVAVIGNAVFMGCERLSTILVDDENKTYRAEENCLILKDGNEIIAGCKTSIIPVSAERIATVAFSRMPITSIDIPATIKKVGGFAFNEWTSMQTIHILGFANRDEACAVWGTEWWYGNSANIIYLGT